MERRYIDSHERYLYEIVDMWFDGDLSNLYKWSDKALRLKQGVGWPDHPVLVAESDGWTIGKILASFNVGPFCLNRQEKGWLVFPTCSACHDFLIQKQKFLF